MTRYLKDYSYLATLLLFFMGIIFTRIIFYPVAGASPEVLGRSYPLNLPDISAGSGDTLSLEGVTAIVSPGTFSRDVYLRVDRTARTVPKSADSLWPSQTRLWQVSDIWNVRFRDHRNDNEMKAEETAKDYNLAFPYTTSNLLTEQGVWLNEISLKLARAETLEGTWSVLSGSVLDLASDKVSVLTRQGGYFMVVGGFTNNSELRVENSKLEDTIEASDMTDRSDKLAPIESGSDESEKSETSQSVSRLESVEAGEQEMTVGQSLKNLYQAMIAVPDALLRSLGLL